jgi:hypothetical protein
MFQLDRLTMVQQLLRETQCIGDVSCLKQNKKVTFGQQNAERITSLYKYYFQPVGLFFKESDSKSE